MRQMLLGAALVGLAVVTAAVLGGHASSSPSTSSVDRVVAAADGVLPDGVTVFEDRLPGVTRLDADLLRALRAAAADAADEGVTVVVNSGWRSPAYQDLLLREAVVEYGSVAEAARWVATPQTSAHVAGDAVDVGSAGTSWLGDRGAAYGLCRVYANEPWHFELRPEATDRGCPPPYADPTYDPRLQPA